MFRTRNCHTNLIKLDSVWLLLHESYHLRHTLYKSMKRYLILIFSGFYLSWEFKHDLVTIYLPRFILTEIKFSCKYNEVKTIVQLCSVVQVEYFQYKLAISLPDFYDTWKWIGEWCSCRTSSKTLFGKEEKNSWRSEKSYALFLDCLNSIMFPNCDI